MANNKTHHYQTQVLWTGNLGQGTAHYRAYKRSHDIVSEGKPPKYNPEELLVASLSSCHMLWYLHLCAKASIVVTHYFDQAVGTMTETQDGSGQFTEVILKPVVTLAPGSEMNQAQQLHEQAHHFCFISSSMNFPVLCQPSIQIDTA